MAPLQTCSMPEFWLTSQTSRELTLAAWQTLQDQLKPFRTSLIPSGLVTTNIRHRGWVCQTSFTWSHRQQVTWLVIRKGDFTPVKERASSVELSRAFCSPEIPAMDLRLQRTHSAAQWSRFPLIKMGWRSHHWVGEGSYFIALLVRERQAVCP